MNENERKEHVIQHLFKPVEEFKKLIENEINSSVRYNFEKTNATNTI